jgi:3-oxoacyl-[acyl-carrier protein] reductase
LDGRVAIVTGAGRGIGRATAILFAEKGAAVACVARSTAELEEVVATIRKAGGNALSIPTDLAQPSAPAEIITAVVGDLGDVDILVNNAATVDPLGATATIDADEWACAINLNVVAPVKLTRLVLGTMLERGWGRIVNLSSGVVQNPAAMPKGNAYTTSKTALEAHTLGLAAEIEGSGVTCNILRPGTVDTAMQQWIREQPVQKIGTAMHERFVGMHEGGKLIEPTRPAEALVAIVLGHTNGQIVDYATGAGEHKTV